MAKQRGGPKPKPALSVAEELRSRARGLEHYLRRQERLHAAGLLTASDVCRSYGGALLSFAADLEAHIERLFIAFLRGRIAFPGDLQRCLVTIKSDVVARAVIRGDKRYVDWLPFEQTVKRADAYFSGGMPFHGLQSQDVRSFERISIIRNAIAHRSSFARTRFLDTFVHNVAPLPPMQRRPEGYLRGVHAGNQTRFEFLMSAAVAAFRSLCQLA